ncbi:MAG: hypothetical protein O2794_01355 [bacterium]|nr:hypothetical protein [bacterium]
MPTIGGVVSKVVEGLATPNHIVHNDSHLYWHQPDGIMRMPINGNEPFLFVETSDHQEVIINNDTLYWIECGADGNRLMKISK